MSGRSYVTINSCQCQWRRCRCSKFVMFLKLEPAADRCDPSQCVAGRPETQGRLPLPRALDSGTFSHSRNCAVCLKSPQKAKLCARKREKKSAIRTPWHISLLRTSFVGILEQTAKATYGADKPHPELRKPIPFDRG